jgi:hypothetical protein
MRGGTRRTMWGGLLLLGALATGCTPFGLARGDHWQGISTGDLGPCPSFDFVELVLDEGRFGGWAQTDHPWGATSWDIRGRLAEGHQAAFETRTEDPRVATRSVQWTGAYNSIFWEVRETPASPGCPVPRVVRFQRK